MVSSVILIRGSEWPGSEFHGNREFAHGDLGTIAVGRK